MKKTIDTKVKITFLALILTLINFIFNSKHFLQIKGGTVETICAAPYENIFMNHFEPKYMYPLIEGKSSIYLRYIDDIFLILINSSKV